MRHSAANPKIDWSNADGVSKIERRQLASASSS
jgi:hypothetical protein